MRSDLYDRGFHMVAPGTLNHWDCPVNPLLIGLSEPHHRNRLKRQLISRHVGAESGEAVNFGLKVILFQQTTATCRQVSISTVTVGDQPSGTRGKRSFQYFLIR